MAELLARIDVRADPDADLGPAVEHLRAGGVVAYPTETVYGFGCTLGEPGMQRLRALKRRDEQKPFIVLVSDAESVSGLAWTPEARELASIFWPGAVTLVLPDPEGLFPEGARSDSGAVAVRVSPQPLVARLLSGLDEPITSTSVNEPGRPPARSGDAVVETVGRLPGPAVLVIDAGPLPESGPSTIIDCTGPTPVVVREGTVPVGRLRCVIPEIHGRPD